MNPNPRTHKSIAIAGAVLFAAVVFMGFYRLSWPDTGTRQNIPAALALELPHDIDEFQAIVRLQPDRVAAGQTADVVFILAYVAFFITFAWGIADNRTMTSMLLATLVTAAMDGVEDGLIHHVASQIPTAGWLRAILIVSCAKWIGFFAVVLSAAVAMQNPPAPEGAQRSDDPPRPGFLAGLAALSFRLFALVGIYGAIASFASSAGRPLVFIAMTGASLTFLAVIGVYAFTLIWPTVPVPEATSA